MKLIYVAGPYRASSENMILANITRARYWATLIWKAGGVAICPHLNSFLMGGVVPVETFLEGDKEIISRCDAILMTGAWRESEGSVIEWNHANRIGKPILTSMAQVRDFLKED